MASSLECEDIKMAEKQEATILCCLCGIAITHNALNMCNNCLQNEIDITSNINRHYVLLQCRGCKRYLRKTNWVACDLESKELLSICLKKIKGIGRTKLADAKFVWTEPHSKRLKVRLVVEGESFNNTMVQQSFLVEFTVSNQQCDTCQKSFTENTWAACVQIRQRVGHKRTFLFLEQLLLKSGLAKEITGMKEVPDGLNMYYEAKSGAARMVDFLRSAIPLRQSHSRRLVSQDFNSNIATFKNTFCVEISPICREDAVLLGSRAARKKLGGGSPLVLCTKVTNQLTFLQPESLKKLVLSANDCFSMALAPLCSSRSLVEFLVIGVSPLPQPTQTKTKNKLLVDVECVRTEDASDETCFVDCRSHLGALLSPGDLCLGYDLRTQNTTEDLSSYTDIPPVILVKKVGAFGKDLEDE